MTIHVSRDVENAINAAVQSGEFASADEMVDKLVREYARRHPVRLSSQSPRAKDGEDTPDPFLGLMRETHCR